MAATANYYWNGQRVTAEEYAQLEKQQIANDAAADAVIKQQEAEFDAATGTGTAQKPVAPPAESATPTANVAPISQQIVTTPNDANAGVTTQIETINGVTNRVTTTPPTLEQPSNQKVFSTEIEKVVPTPAPAPALPTEPTLAETTVTAKAPADFGDDWRVKLTLAEEANYLYKEPGITSDNVLFPLKNTNGVIFPYLPAINIAYKANYNATDITHTNYKNYFYTNSSVDDISITADFTAQDNVEAKYMLAVIHFFKSVTKMFYGQDTLPRGGTPPPLCYLTGLGSYQFNNHPLVISSFSYNLPNDVDYIRTETLSAFTAGGIPDSARKNSAKSNIFNDFLSKHRLFGANLNKGAVPSKPNFTSITSPESKVTYVPTKLQIQINAYPIVSRKDISENFKLGGKNGYASGELIKGGFW